MKIAARDIFKNFSGEVGREIVEENFFFFFFNSILFKNHFNEHLYN